LTQAVHAAAARLASAGVAFGHGTTNAHDEAAWLLLWQLGLPLDALDEHAERPVSPAEAARFDELLARRIHTRQPAAYLTGEAWLQGVPFKVDERVIVPRSLIAELLADADSSGALDAWLAPETRWVLDLCTGNGSLAVLAALAWPDVEVLATDLSADALAVAALNVQRHGLAGRVRLAQGDGWAAIAEPEPFDLVICNPPYVNSRSMSALPPEYRAEPAMSLAGGTDGMDFIRPLLAGLRPHLARDGVLVLEIGHEIEHFHRAFPRLPIIGLPTSAGDEQVLLIEAAALRFLP
jgi:ribosomal protein L3 glutamine methyltransferase